jgi:hypothetical protein
MRLLIRVIPITVLAVGLAFYVRYHRVAPAVAHKLGAAAPQVPVLPQGSAAQGSDAEVTPAVTMVGPLANYMQPTDSAPAPASGVAAPSASAAEYSGGASDRVWNTLLGPGGEILPAKFSLTRNAAFSFDVPAHANSPRLAGKYHATEAGAAAPVNVDFMVLTADQYAALAKGIVGEALFSAESSAGQSVDFILPITGDSPVRYYVVFRGDAKTKKLVICNLRLEL